MRSDGKKKKERKYNIDMTERKAFGLKGMNKTNKKTIESGNFVEKLFLMMGRKEGKASMKMMQKLPKLNERFDPMNE